MITSAAATLRAGFGVVPSASLEEELPAWVEAQPLWTWFEIPNTNPTHPSLVPVPTPWGATGPKSRIDGWCGATLKRSGSTYLVGAAGGHGDYGGNEVIALTLNTTTPTWQLLCNSSPDSAMLNMTSVYLDGRRAPSHTYWSTQFLPTLNKMVIVAGQCMNSDSLPMPPPDWPYPNDSMLGSFSLATNTWDAPLTLASYPGVGDFTAALNVAHPITGDILHAREGSNAWKYTVATNSWSYLPGLWSPGYAGSALDHTRGRVLVVGDYSGTAPPRVWNWDAGTEISVTFGGLGASALSMNNYPGIVYDEVNDNFLVFRDDGEGTNIICWRVNPSTWFVDMAPVTNTIGYRPNGMQNAVQYVPELKGVVVANEPFGNVKFMRTA